MEAPPPLRRFVFVNWHGEDDASLEVTATGFTISEEFEIRTEQR